MFSQAIPLGELRTLQLNANGAVIGLARCSNEHDRGSPSVPQRPSDPLDTRRSTTNDVARVTFLRRITSIDDHRETAGNDSMSRDYFGFKPETVMTSAGRVHGDEFHRQQRQRRSMSDIASPLHQSRARRRDAISRQQPETVDVNDGAAGRQANRRHRPQSDGRVVSSVDLEIARRSEHRRRTDRDAGSIACEDDAPRRRRQANDCRKELRRSKQTGDNDKDGDRITMSANVDANRAADVGVPLTKPKTEATRRVDEERSIDEDPKITMENVAVASSSTPVADCRFSSSHPADSQAAARRIARDKSAAAVVARTNQIWWPYQESSDEKESNDDDSSSDNDHGTNKDEDNNNNTAAAAAANNDTAKVMSWTELDASVEESIRELDNFLLQQDSAPL